MTETETISGLARRHALSRKFVYRQAAKAEEALQTAFSPGDGDDQKVLLQLPAAQSVVAPTDSQLTLICHSSLRGVLELFGDVFDCSISVGTVHNVLQAAVGKARSCNERQDLCAVRIGAQGEIFQSGEPVLVGISRLACVISLVVAFYVVMRLFTKKCHTLQKRYCQAFRCNR